MSIESQRLGYIDSLRGFAVLGVLLVHCTEIAPVPPVPLASQGARGVQLFFVVSAFTLLLSMFERSRREPHHLRNFYLRRFFRIAPLFYCAMCVSLGLDGLSPRFSDGPPLHLSDVVTTSLFVNGWHARAINAIVPGGWSIAVEVTFYAILPFLFARIRSFQSALCAWFGAVAFSIAASPVSAALAGSSTPHALASEFDFFWFPGQLPVFLSGFILFFALRERNKPLTFYRAQLACALCLAGLYSANAFWGWRLHLHATSSGAGILFSVLAYMLARGRPPLLVNPVTRYIGQVSYSAYICQFWVIRLMLSLKLDLNPFPSAIRLPVAFLLALAATMGLSACLHKAIELPGQSAGRRLIERLERRPGLAESVSA